MPDLHVVATFKAKPGQADGLCAVLSSLVAPTRREPGCISYVLERAVDDPATFFTVERWKTDDDLKAHMVTPHVKAALVRVPDLLGAPAAIIKTLEVPGTEAAA